VAEIRKKLRKLIRDEKGSPVTEEALLIGLAIIIFTGILMLVANIRKFVEEQYEKLAEEFSQSIFPLGFNNTEIPDLGTYLSSWSSLGELIIRILKLVFSYLIYIAMFVGGIMILWGAIEWATGYNETSGKKTIIKGAVLVLLALAPMLATL